MGAVWLSSSLYPESVLSAEETMASLLTEMGVTVPNSTTFAEESRSAYSEVGQLSPSEVREQRKAYIDNRQRLFDESLEQQSESALVTEDELEEARRAGEAERERRENEIAQRVSS